MAIAPVHIKNRLNGGICASTRTEFVFSCSISLSLISISAFSDSTIASIRSLATPVESLSSENFSIFSRSPCTCSNSFNSTLPAESHSSQAYNQALSGGIVIMLSLTISLIAILSFVVITCGLYVLQLTTHRAIIAMLTIFNFVNCPIKAANIFA